MDAIFYHYANTPSLKVGGSSILITTNLTRIQSHMQRRDEEERCTLDDGAIHIDHGEVIDRGHNLQELLVLLGAPAVTQRLEALELFDKKRIRLRIPSKLRE